MEILSLSRDDFTVMLGPLQELLDRSNSQYGKMVLGGIGLLAVLNAEDRNKLAEQDQQSRDSSTASFARREDSPAPSMPEGPRAGKRGSVVARGSISVPAGAGAAFLAAAGLSDEEHRKGAAKTKELRLEVQVLDC